MITTRSQHYCSPSPVSSKGRSSDLLDVEQMVVFNKVFQPTLAWRTATRSHILWVGSFDEIKEKTWGSIRDRFSDQVGPFPCNIGKFGLGHGWGRSVNAIPVSMTGMRSSYCPNIWSTRRFRLMNNEGMLLHPIASPKHQHAKTSL